MKTESNYSCAHTAMLNATSSILRSLEECIADFTRRNSNINLEFCKILNQELDHCNVISGVDSKKSQKEVTKNTVGLGKQFATMLRGLNADIDYGYSAEEAALIKSSIGIDTLMSTPDKKKKLTLNKAVLAYINNIKNYQRDFLAKGMNKDILNETMAIANKLFEASQEQTYEKGTSIRLTSESQEVMNAFYTKIMQLCKLAKIIYIDDAARAALFTFSLVVKQFVTPRTRKPKVTPTTEVDNVTAQQLTSSL